MNIMKMKAFVVLTALACILAGVAGKCSYEGIFNLGDSNSDTGAYYSAFPSLGYPFGITYFHKPVESSQVVYCGYTGTVGGQKVNATVCSDRQRYVNWDGIHLTDAANRIVAEAVLAGSYFDPPFPISDFCHIKPVG